MKVMTIVGTRPEIIKLSCVMQELDGCVEHVLVHTGQNFDYELNEIFFEQMGLRKPDVILKARSGNTPMQAIGDILEDVDVVLETHRPDAVLVLGDTNSGLAVLAAKRRKIPIFHMEAGNRCFDQRVPEEINRKIIDHVSDINLPYTEHARRYLLAEGLPADRVIKTGSPMREVMYHYANQIATSKVLENLGLVDGDYLVVSLHREENVDDAVRLHALVETVNLLSIRWPVVFSVHPRTRKRLEDMNLVFTDDVKLMKPLGFFDYVQLQRNAKCVISDSGTITEEAAILKFPAVTVRQAHERPEGMDVGSVIMTDLGFAEVRTAVDVAIEHGGLQYMPDDYVFSDVSKKVVRIILSYTDYVMRNVWRQ